MNFSILFILIQSVLSYSTFILEYNCPKVITINNIKYRESSCIYDKDDAIWVVETNVPPDQEYTEFDGKLYTPKTLLKDVIVFDGCKYSDKVDFKLNYNTDIYFASRNKDGYLLLNEKVFENDKIHKQNLNMGEYSIYLYICSSSIPSDGNGFQDTRWLGVWYKDENKEVIVKLSENIYLSYYLKDRFESNLIDFLF